MPTKKRTFTNADLPVTTPVDDFQPDDFEPDTIEDDFIADEEPEAPSIVSTGRGRIPSADSFDTGFIRSVLGGDAYKAGVEGAKGWLEGGIDIPGSIMSMIETGKNLYNDPVGTIKSIPSGMRAMLELAQQAGSRPREFGNMVGQQTGQPLLTAGLVKAAPSVVRGTGAVAETGGRILKNYQPVTGTIPRIAEPRVLRSIERAVGKGVENVGKRMRNVGKGSKVTVLDGEVVGESPIAGRAVSPDIETSYRRALPPSKTSFYSGPGEGVTPKPKVRLNPDGSYTDLNTGEMFGPDGKPLPIPDELTRNSDFFNKNRTLDTRPMRQRIQELEGLPDDFAPISNNPSSLRNPQLVDELIQQILDGSRR